MKERAYSVILVDVTGEIIFVHSSAVRQLISGESNPTLLLKNKWVKFGVGYIKQRVIAVNVFWVSETMKVIGSTSTYFWDGVLIQNFGSLPDVSPIQDATMTLPDCVADAASIQDATMTLLDHGADAANI
jgi:hypothetical protein